MSISHQSVRAILSGLDASRESREELYRHFHRNPELSLREHETSARIRKELVDAGIDVTAVGDTGLVAVINNGEGPVVAMRADIDGLPIREDSGKGYASTATQTDPRSGEQSPVSHTCGHDFHIMNLLGALQAFHAHKDAWSGTYVGVFQPAEETAEGARDMVDKGVDTLMPKPDVYLGQHVLASLPGGVLGTSAGPTLSTAASIRVVLHGNGSHGSMPHLGVDPVVLASSIVVRLQSIVSREIAPGETAVVTVGSIRSGSKSNVIPSTAELLINTRAFDADVSEHLHEAIERIIRAECDAARCPKEPEFTYYDRYPLTDNDEEPTLAVHAAFEDYFGADGVTDLAQVPASEDFSVIPDELGVPYTYWGLGGFADQENAPGNHNPGFAPDLQPTLDRGLEGAVVAAAAWLATEK